jgi:hypothetical protein
VVAEVSSVVHPHHLFSISPVHPLLRHRSTLALPTPQSLLEPLLHRLSLRRLSRSPEQSLRLARNLPGTYVLAALLGVSAHHVDSKSYKEPVTLIVGAAKEHYCLHKDLLCFYSDFFRAAFNGFFKEATERKIELAEVETDVFEAFQVWLYTQDLSQNDTVSKDIYPDWSLLIKLWIFGDKYQIPLLQNNTMDKIVAKADKDHNIPLLWITHVYENTTVNSVLRKAIVDVMSYRSRMPDGKNYHKIEGTCLHNPKDWPKQACLDVIAEMSRGWLNKDTRFKLPTREKCYYHVHADGEHC